MRTLQLAPYIDMSGANRAMVTHVEEMAKRGPTIAFVVVEGAMADECRRVGATVVTAFGHQGWPKSRMKRFIGVISTLKRAVREHEIQLIHSHGSIGSHYCLPVAILTNTPWVCHQRGRFEGGWGQFGIGQAAQIIAVSNWVKEGMPPRLQKKTTAIYDATEIPDTPPEPEAPGGFLRIGMAGACGKSKGHDLVVDAAALLMERYPFEVHIWGLLLDKNHVQYPWSKFVRDKVAALPKEFQQRFHLEDFRFDMENYYKSIDISVVPSRYADAFPRMMTEPMARYKPVVCSKIGGMIEFIQEGENGLKFDEDDVQGLAHQLERLLTDSALRAKLRANGRATVEKYVVPKAYGDRIEALYRKVLAEH
jgi:glycosyltransferase involved in cell wall biosynthesis